ncbi:MAG: hypothetical protein LAO76_22750 [Acidobacteriia bacterium]|nr:hypothetical protein [Terriglobia bacterium]
MIQSTGRGLKLALTIIAIFLGQVVLANANSPTPPAGFMQSTSVILHNRITANGGFCTFNNTSIATCSVPWSGSSFVDTNYTAVCTSDTLGLIVGITAKSTSGINVRLQSVGGILNSGNFPILECVGIHD